MPYEPRRAVGHYERAMINLNEEDLSDLEGFLDILRCPRSGQRLVIENETLATMDGRQRYRLAHTGIPMFAEDFVSPEAETQRRHYNRLRSPTPPILHTRIRGSTSPVAVAAKR